MSKKLFQSGVVGSLPRPNVLLDFLPENPGKKSSEIASSKEMDKLVNYAISIQELAGLDLISDGEWRRHAYTHIIADIATGFTPDNRIEPHRWGITITEKMEVINKGLIAKEAEFLVKSTDRFSKVCVPSPYLLAERLWEKELSAKAYSTRELFIKDLIPILNRELLLLKDTGVTVIQIDDPHLCVLVDPKIRSQFKNPKYEMGLAADNINAILDGVNGVTLALHLCRRNWGRSGWGADGSYNPIIDVMKRINVDQYVLEFSIPSAGDFEILKKLPEDSLIGLGCVGCRFEHIDTPEEIVSRVEKAISYVDPNRISLNPDCGFSPGKIPYAPLEEAYQKLKNEVKASNILREKYE